MSPITPLTPDAIEQRRQAMPAWTLAGGMLTRTCNFASFGEAIDFVVRVADAAEKAGHHPDIDIRYTKVTLRLITHDAGGITTLDFDLAADIDRLS